MRLVVLLAVMLSACIPTARSLNAERGRLWVAPNSPTVFSWVSTVEHRETRVLELGKNDSEVRHEEDDDPVHTAIYAVDPVSGTETRLGQLDGAGGDPVYYDAPRDILWVRSGKEDELDGLTRSGKPVTGPHHHRQLEIKALQPPFVLARDPLGVVALHDLRRDGSVALNGIDKSEITVVGDVIRFTGLSEQGDSVRIQQLAIDWSSGQPQRLPDVDWSTAPLAAAVGTRLAIAVMRDGRRYAEVIRDGTGTRLLVFDITAPAAPPIQIPLPATGSPDRPKAHLVAIADDVLVFGEGGEGELACWQGATVRVDRQQVVPLAGDSCVIDAKDVGPHRVLLVKDRWSAVVGPDGAIVSLEVDSEDLAKGISTAPNIRVVAHDDGELEQIDFATGERRLLTRGEAKDHLLAIDASGARYARGADKLVTLPLRAGATASVVVLGEPPFARIDRMPRDRTEFWLGVGGGATTRGNGAGGLNAEIAHWVTDHRTMVFRGNLRFEADKDDEETQYFDGGVSFGYAWHRLPRLFSIFVEADVGANFAGTYVGKDRSDATFAPSVDVRVGWQGKMLGFDLSAMVPSLIDIDRGVLFMLSGKIGFTENQH